MLIIIYFINTIYCIVTYSVLKEDCLEKKIENDINPFIFFEIDPKNFEFKQVKYKYRKLALSCHPDRLIMLYKEYLLINNLSVNMILINKYFEKIKNYIPKDQIYEEKKEEKKKKYNDFSLKERFLFKFKRYFYIFFGIIIIYFRKYVFYLLIFCLSFISLYIFGFKIILIIGIIFIFKHCFCYFCFCCCHKKKKKKIKIIIRKNEKKKKEKNKS